MLFSGTWLSFEPPFILVNRHYLPLHDFSAGVTVAYSFSRCEFRKTVGKRTKRISQRFVSGKN